MTPCAFSRRATSRPPCSLVEAEVSVDMPSRTLAGGVAQRAQQRLVVGQVARVARAVLPHHLAARRDHERAAELVPVLLRRSSAAPCRGAGVRPCAPPTSPGRPARTRRACSRARGRRRCRPPCRARAAPARRCPARGGSRGPSPASPCRRPRAHHPWRRSGPGRAATAARARDSAVTRSGAERSSATGRSRPQVAGADLLLGVRVHQAQLVDGAHERPSLARRPRGGGGAAGTRAYSGVACSPARPSSDLS